MDWAYSLQPWHTPPPYNYDYTAELAQHKSAIQHICCCFLNKDNIHITKYFTLSSSLHCTFTKLCKYKLYLQTVCTKYYKTLQSRPHSVLQGCGVLAFFIPLTRKCTSNGNNITMNCTVVALYKPRCSVLAKLVHELHYLCHCDFNTCPQNTQTNTQTHRVY